VRAHRPPFPFPGCDKNTPPLILPPIKNRTRVICPADPRGQAGARGHVPGVGTVVGGIVTQGAVQVNDTVWLGPNSNGHFRQV